MARPFLIAKWWEVASPPTAVKWTCWRLTSSSQRPASFESMSGAAARSSVAPRCSSPYLKEGVLENKGSEKEVSSQGDENGRGKAVKRLRNNKAADGRETQ